jgi:LPS export ABC transporter protein LptC
MPVKLNARNVIGFSILILAGALVALVARNFTGSLPGETTTLEALPGNVDLALKEISYTETSGGIRRWTLVADSAAHSIGEGTTRIENIRMTFYDVDGLGDLTLTANEGNLNSVSREVSVGGDVVVKSPKGYVLYTDWLHYRESDRMVRTDAPVRLVSDSMEITGAGMSLNVGDHSVVLLNDVKAHIASFRKAAG